VGRLALGIVAGCAIAAAAGLVWLRGDACLGRCGAETRCLDHLCVPAVARPTAAPAKVERRARSRGELPLAQAEEQLRPGDERPLVQGDALGRPEHIDLSEAGSAGELSDADLDRVFRASQPAILRCITDAIGDAPLTSGQVEVGFRVERTGAVSRVRVEAPALLQRRGLTRCVHAIVIALGFPPSGGASVASYPFALR